MRVTVVRPGDLGPSEAARWAALQRTPPVTLSPFLSLTFAQAVGRHRPGARVAVVTGGGQIEAFLPFELATRGMATAGMAMPIGYPMNNLQGFVGSGVPIDAKAVLRQAGLRGWRFRYAPADQEALRPHAYAEAEVQCPVIDLSAGYEAYHQGLNKKVRYEADRRRRGLERSCETVSLEWHSAQPAAALTKLIEWKSGMYGGARDLFADPAAVRIADELSSTVSEDCAGVLSVLSAGPTPIAAMLSLAEPHGLSTWFPSYDAEYRHSSPGTMLSLAVAQEAARRGITLIDFSAGQDAYKFRLANGSYPVVGGAVWAHRAEEMGRRIYRRFAESRSAGPRQQSPAAKQGVSGRDG
ncbi:MAG TPA: GNAT family N-acetyltransferase [Streptosporangiaceae bacterium]|jgi:CelD/BcsL family acetyltransferase involved in cellulose biosynthesis|nr:GNAT family N-acetyltransferase [Streptosporangiaceae bacterium]